MSTGPSDAAPSKLATASLVLACAAAGFAVLTVISGALELIPGASGPFGALAASAPFLVAAAVTFALAAMIVALVARSRRKERRSRVSLAIAIPGVVVGVPLLAVGLYLASLLGVFHENVAQTQAGHAVQAYTSRGATILCENGNNGYGMDNTQPWYVAYLDAPESLGTRAVARQALKAAGVDGPVVPTPSSSSDQKTPASSIELASPDGTVRLEVARVGKVAQYCGGGIDYGRGNQVKPGRVLVAVSIILPSRNG